MESKTGLSLRDLASVSPAWFAQYATGGRYHCPPHIMLFEKLALSVARKDIRKLMINIPPRHGKSEYWSQYFPAWYLGRFADERFLLSSYSSEFATTWGRKSKQLIEDYGNAVFGIELNTSSKSSHRWDIRGRRGGMSTAGALASITGKGANVMLIDDPIKNDVEANSKLHRERLQEWYKATAYTRLEPNGTMIIIMTRWHEDDLCGTLLREESDWIHIDIPAIAVENDVLGRELGDALWTERYNVGQLLEIKKTIGNYWFSCLYQQNPVPRGGHLFNRAWFEIVDAVPDKMTVVRGWDKAATEGGGCETAGVAIGRKGGTYYILDCVHAQHSAYLREELIKQTSALDAQQYTDYWVAVEEEGGSGGKDSMQMTMQNLSKYAVYAVKPQGSKEARAFPIAAQAEAGNVKILRGAWNKDFIEQLEVFPQGRLKDMVDAATTAYNFLQEIR